MSDENAAIAAQIKGLLFDQPDYVQAHYKMVLKRFNDLLDAEVKNQPNDDLKGAAALALAVFAAELETKLSQNN